MFTKSGIINVNPGSPLAETMELIDGDVLVVGRRPPAPSKNMRTLVFDFPEVSSKHAEIRSTTDGWVIVDLGSKNGTQVNGWNLHPGKEHLLRPGDRVTIGNNELIVHPPIDPMGPEHEGDTVDSTQWKVKLINATILVGDIRGFTSLMEDHADEPEPVMRVAQAIFDDLGRVIINHDGCLEKVAGDAIMAYWKINDRSEFDTSKTPTVQACEAALHMRRMALKLAENKATWPFQGNPFVLDIALATGPVAEGALGHATLNPAILGDTANLVFRLEKLIGEDSPGDIIVEESTYNLVKDHFDFKPLGEFEVKGRRRKAEVYRLLDKTLGI